MLQQPSYKYFYLSVFIAGILWVLTGLFILIYGKAGSFLLINGYHSPPFDFFFKYYTYAGDGIMWVLVLLYCIFFRREYFIAVIAGIIISTILSQFLKRVVYPDELRPITYFTEKFPVHVIKGIFINRVHSFPSGHASAAFTMALLMSLMINKKTWSIILPFLALLVGYSRAYLAQHFVTDVFAGTIIGIVSAVLSVVIWQRFVKRKSHPPQRMT
ncbi:MAG: phosphatase PAP2 family protein [Chitinophagaceae bacterium]|nr:MAG: phosphatase PAP2 family protein [Chitinophagaceae bacterium]